jgi:hypothetical protein
MAKITIAGTVQLTKTGSTKVLTLWETEYNATLAKDIRVPYKLWMNVPATWTEGTSVVIEGRVSMRVSTNEDGTPRTYVDSKGNTITAHDLNVNDVIVLEEILKNPAPAGVDMDDVRKYGTSMDEAAGMAPF